MTVFDPFMGSGTTIGEAHKLGFTALGRDINPVAVESVRTALGPMDRDDWKPPSTSCRKASGEDIRALVPLERSQGRPCDVLYFFWAMQVPCLALPQARRSVPVLVIARNAYPSRKPEVQILCPACGDIFPGLHGQERGNLPLVQDRNLTRSTDRPREPKRPARIATRASRSSTRSPRPAPARLPALRQACAHRGRDQGISARHRRRSRRLPGMLGTVAGRDQPGRYPLPTLALENGYNTRQAMSYGFTTWRDFFNDRQLLALGWLHSGDRRVADAPARAALLTLFSGVLEFNNMFASYKGEGTGAVRHMFSHHILKPERTPIEANVWGTPKSSGSFSNLFRSRLLRAIEYRLAPTEVNGTGTAKGRVCASPFSGQVEDAWPGDGRFAERAIYLSCGDSADTACRTGASISSSPIRRSSTTSITRSSPISSMPGSN